MKRTSMLPAMAALLALTFAAVPVFSQDQSSPSVAPNEVSPGTRFLIRLDDDIVTGNSKSGDAFSAHTLVPIASADGTTLPPGAEIRGHVDKIDAAHKTGHAKLWLTFDDIKTPNGWVPLVAMVDDVPGVHAIRVDYNREGEIEAAADKRDAALQAAAAAALVGAAPGIVAKDKKEAAMGAASAAVTAYMSSTAMGQELTLQKNTRLEIMLERSLFFGRT
jgi:hypothetical protein